MALAATKVGLPAAPVSIIGADLIPSIDELQLPIDISSVAVLPGTTCSFSLHYDHSDQLETIDYDFGVSEQLTSHAMSCLDRFDSLHVCCRRPLDVEAILESLSNKHKPFSLDFFVSSAHEMIARARPYLKDASRIFTNSYEFALLKDAVDISTLQDVIVTDGPNSVRLLRQGIEVASMLPPVRSTVEVTGAGDTLCGSFLGFVSQGFSDAESLEGAIQTAAASTQTVLFPLAAPESGDR